MSRASKKKKPASNKTFFSPVLVAVAVLAGLAWVAVKVPVGERTLWEHGRLLVETTKGQESRPVATEAVRNEPGRADHVAHADQPPAEELTQEDRDALEALLPR